MAVQNHALGVSGNLRGADEFRGAVPQTHGAPVCAAGYRNEAGSPLDGAVGPWQMGGVTPQLQGWSDSRARDAG